jgi:hypothetical protein
VFAPTKATSLFAASLLDKFRTGITVADGWYKDDM